MSKVSINSTYHLFPSTVGEAFCYSDFQVEYFLLSMFSLYLRKTVRIVLIRVSLLNKCVFILMCRKPICCPVETLIKFLDVLFYDKTD